MAGRVLGCGYRARRAPRRGRRQPRRDRTDRDLATGHQIGQPLNRTVPLPPGHIASRPRTPRPQGRPAAGPVRRTPDDPRHRYPRPLIPRHRNRDHPQDRRHRRHRDRRRSRVRPLDTQDRARPRGGRVPQRRLSMSGAACRLLPEISVDGPVRWVSGKAAQQATGRLGPCSCQCHGRSAASTSGRCPRPWRSGPHRRAWGVTTMRTGLPSRCSRRRIPSWMSDSATEPLIDPETSSRPRVTRLTSSSRWRSPPPS